MRSGKYAKKPASEDKLGHVVVIGSTLILLDTQGKFINVWHVIHFDRVVPGTLDIWER